MKKFDTVYFEQPRVMGILNLTPDSFYDGNRYLKEEEYIRRVGQMLDEGADIIDAGAVSTRPGAAPVSAAEEIRRLEAPLRNIRKHFPGAVLSLDTFRKKVAERFWKEGLVNMINDISGGTMDKDMLKCIDENHIPYVLMHIQGTPPTMQNNPHYADIVSDIRAFFLRGLEHLQNTTAPVILDPGFGFGKTLRDNYVLLKRLKELAIENHPLLVGVSRKSMIYKLLNTVPEKALNGTAAVHTIALLNHAKILRVHDVKEAKEIIEIVSFYNAE